jgi:coproporphyrinogen III oxidase-like Fe-S oxidoreductase
VHDRAQAMAAVEEAAQRSTPSTWTSCTRCPARRWHSWTDLTQALAFAPPHISIYHLTIEPNTYFAKFPPKVPEDDMAYAMLDRITE